MTQLPPKEITLDPDDWEGFRALAHRMLDETIDNIRDLHEGPAWQPPPSQVRNHILEEPIPREPQGDQAVYEQFSQEVWPYRNGNLDPRFYGWVQGTGTPLAFMADMLASAMNPHLAGCNQSPVLVEQKVIEWLREALGFPAGTSGLLLSGATMANLTGLAVARNIKAGYDLRKEGLQGARRELTVYGSTETHIWATKAVEFLGMGRNSFRKIEVDSNYEVDVAALRQAVAEDRQEGKHPIAILGSAGTVNTGATDNLNALADLAAQESLWFHVDGAFGALAALSPNLKTIVSGLERADSVAFDLHKWMYLPFEIGCLLVRDGDAHRATFSQNATYLAPTDRGVIAGGIPFADLGIELTRGFKALKAWMCLKSYGFDKIAALIGQNVDQARYLAQLIAQSNELELMAPAPLNVVCFRYKANPERVNALNEEILLTIQERGIAVPSSTLLDGHYCIRACFVNHRTRTRDVEDLVEAVIKIGRELTKA